MWEIQISMKTWGKTVKKAVRFIGKLENFLNGKIRTTPLAAAPHMCITSELLPLFLFYLAAPRQCTMGFKQYKDRDTLRAVSVI